MKEIAIKIDNLSKFYKTYAKPRYRLQELLRPILSKFSSRFDRKYSEEFWALKNINLEINKGEAFGIIGKNGAGKSTLLQIIAGTLSPSEGSLNVVGRVNALLELGSGFNPEFTGKENVYMNGSILGFSKQEIDNKYNEIWEFSEIGDFINQPVKTYSSGMFVRLAFSVQAMLEPDVLIVDEALSVGDIFFQQKCHKKIESLLSTGNTTFLFVTHDMGSIDKYCDRALVLERGKAIFCGDKKSAILSYYRPNAGNTITKNKYFKPNKSDLSKNSTIIGHEKYFRLETVSIFNKTKNAFSNNIDLNDIFEVQFLFKILKSINSSIIDFTIKDYRGIPIYSTSSVMLRKLPISNLNSNDSLSISFELKNILKEGLYVISVGVAKSKINFMSKFDFNSFSDDKQEFITSYENVAEFEVINSKRILPKSNGLVDLSSKLNIKVIKNK